MMPNTRRYAAAARFVGGEIYLMGGSDISSHHLVKQVDVYQPSTGKWRTGPECPDPRDFPVVTSSGSNLVFAGGLGADGKASDRLDLFNYASQKWTTGSRMPIAVSRAAGDIWGTYTVMTGGLLTEPVSSVAVQLYHRQTRQWSRGPDMPISRHGHTCTAIGDTIYVVGGECGDAMTTSNSVISLKTGAKTWNTLADLPHARAFHATVTYKGKLYVFGNRGPAEHSYRYDPVTNKWSELKCSDIGSHRMAYAEANGMVYFYGGEGTGSLDRVFDLDRERWDTTQGRS